MIHLYDNKHAQFSSYTTESDRTHSLRISLDGAESDSFQISRSKYSASK